MRDGCEWTKMNEEVIGIGTGIAQRGKERKLLGVLEFGEKREKKKEKESQ